MHHTPYQKQSRYEGGRRPWNLAPVPVKARNTGYQCKTRREEIEACLNCPLPKCKVNWCPILRKLKQKSAAHDGSTSQAAKADTGGLI